MSACLCVSVFLRESLKFEWTEVILYSLQMKVGDKGKWDYLCIYCKSIPPIHFIVLVTL